MGRRACFENLGRGGGFLPLIRVGGAPFEPPCTTCATLLVGAPPPPNAARTWGAPLLAPLPFKLSLNPTCAEYESLPEGPADQPKSTAPPARGPLAAGTTAAVADALAVADVALEDLPAPLQLWDASSTLMSLLLGCSMATFVMAVSISPLGGLAALCGVAAGCLYMHAAWRGADLARTVRRIHWLSAIAAVLSAALFLFFFFFLAATMSHQCAENENHDDQGEWCEEVVEMMLFAGVWFGLFGALSAAVYKRFGDIRLMLNPCSTGIFSV